MARVKPGGGAEIFLKTTPFQWLGKLSYSLYLWHWPLLIIPVQATGSALTLPQSFGLVALALALSVITYFAAENPIRRSPRLNRNAIASLALGLALVATSYLVCTQEIQAHRTRPTAEVTRTGE